MEKLTVQLMEYKIMTDFNILQEQPTKNGKKRNDRDEKGRFIAGNPGGGRPKDSISITSEIKKKLLEYTGKEKKKIYLELFIVKILNKALVEGDTSMLKQIWAYIDGMPKQQISIDNLEITQTLNYIEKLSLNQINVGSIQDNGKNIQGKRESIDHPASI